MWIFGVGENSGGGTARLSEALQAHVWPQMEMKYGNQNMLPTAQATSLTKELLSDSEKLLAEGFDQGQDPGGASFEELFAKFADMKGIDAMSSAAVIGQGLAYLQQAACSEEGIWLSATVDWS